MSVPRLELADWRRQVAMLYASVRAAGSPEEGHALWRAGRDELFLHHPQSPLGPDHEMRKTGVPYWPYDPSYRFEVELVPGEPDVERVVPTSADGDVRQVLVGRLALPAPVGGLLDVWWLHQYGGGIFIPVKDATARFTSYGAGRYLLDTIKGADLGGTGSTVVVDFNFLYHPSCRYDPQWDCPLAGPGNTLAAEINAGERLEP
ncbi:DUF1684 domain-containing protein [Acidothermaceae bacterium B102]|nr:DUF1684 domain-containing protein [Acidothermaceae bacterium B102]